MRAKIINWRPGEEYDEYVVDSAEECRAGVDRRAYEIWCHHVQRFAAPWTTIKMGQVLVTAVCGEGGPY